MLLIAAAWSGMVHRFRFPESRERDDGSHELER